MGLIVRFRGGPLAGELREFADEIELVRFGRDPERCEVVFPEAARAVSREHCALRRVLGTWRLVLNGSSPVWIEGRLAHDEQVLDCPCEIVVGRDGPALLVESTGALALVTTQGEKVPQPGAHTRLERLGGGLRRHRALAFGAALVLALALAWLGFEVHAEKNRFDLRLAELDSGQASALKHAVDGWAARNPERVELSDVLERARPSVFAVLALRPERDPEPIGTAFAIEGHRAATNAHVASEVLHRQADHQHVVLRTGTLPPRDFEVVDARMHPGYDAFQALMAEHRAIDPLTGEPLGLVPACDVALLLVDEAGAAAFPAALELAPEAECRALRAGAAVCALGFPAEGLLGHGADLARPAATSQSGHVTSVTDFFQGETTAEEAVLVHHDLPGVGGASGSPVLDERGRVVALHSAGSFSFVPRFDLAGGGMLRGAGGEAALQRIPTTGYFFAQRADLLQELVDGRSAALHDARIAGWRARFQELRLRGHGFLRDHFTQQMSGVLRREIEARQGTVRAMPEILERELVVPGAQSELDTRLDGQLEAGIYLATGVAAAPEPIVVRVVDPNGQTLGGQGPLGASCVAFRLGAPGTIHVVVARPTADPGEVRIQVRLVRIETAP